MLKIIIIEDEVTSLNILSRVLGSLECDIVKTFDNGESFLNELSNFETVDLILVDINLNGKLSGIDTVNKMKETIDLPVIYITSYDNPSIFKEAIKTEPSGYITKPYKKINLQSQLDIFKINQKKLKSLQDKIEILENNISN